MQLDKQSETHDSFIHTHTHTLTHIRNLDIVENFYQNSMKFRHEIKNFSNMYVINRVVAWPSLSVKKLNVMLLKRQQKVEEKQKRFCSFFFVFNFSQVFIWNKV